MKVSFTKIRFGKPHSKILLVIWMFPFLWIIGGERLLLPFIVTITLFRNVSHLSVMPKTFSLFFFFLLGYLASITQVRESLRFITFFWDFSIYFTFLLILLEFYYHIPEDKYREVIKNLVTLFFFLNLLACTYITIGYWEYKTPLGYLLPDGIKSTSVAQNISLHKVGGERWFFGLTYRLSSIFSSGMQYAASLLLMIPLNYYVLATSKKKSKLFFTISLILSFLCLLYSQGRVAILLGSLALIASIVMNGIVKTRFFSKSIVSFLLLLVLIGFSTIISINWQIISEIFNHIFVERRAGSYNERLAVYLNTIDGVKNSPVLGHGTQLDFPGAQIPLGSHNWYLGILFKHGLIGFIPFMLFLFYLIKSSVISVFRIFRNDEKRKLAVILSICIVSHAVLSLTAEPVVDAMHSFLLAMIYGMSFKIYTKAKIKQSV